MTRLTLTARYQQARLYAAQVRVRREMGDAYAHAKSTHINNRRIVDGKLEIETPVASVQPA
jgi:hypothetical protein